MRMARDSHLRMSHASAKGLRELSLDHLDGHKFYSLKMVARSYEEADIEAMGVPM